MKFKLFSKKKKYTLPKNSHLSVHEKALRDWEIVFPTFVALGILLVGAHVFWLYTSTHKSFEASPTISDAAFVAQKKTVQRVIGDFDQKQTDYEAFKNSALPEIDPSL